MNITRSLSRLCAFPAASVLLYPLVTIAQPTTDIGLTVPSNTNTIQVRVRPNGSSFSGVVSAMTFTIRWETASGATMAQPASLVITQNCASGYQITPSGDGPVTNGAYTYYTFNAFGAATMSSACPANTWPANTETVVATIPFTRGPGCANFNIVNDTYTGGANRNYFMSLNGLNKTGVITSSPVKVVRGDMNGDAIVNATDFGLFSVAFGSNCSFCAADMNNSGSVNATDYGLFSTVFGTSCP